MLFFKKYFLVLGALWLLLQTLLWSRMTCSSKIFQYPFPVLADTPASYILIFWLSCIFNGFHCCSLLPVQKKGPGIEHYLESKLTYRTVKHHCLWLQNEHGQQFCKEFAPRPVGTNNNETIPANRSFYWRAKYNNQENYYPATEGRSHDNFHSCIFIPG